MKDFSFALVRELLVLGFSLICGISNLIYSMNNPPIIRTFMSSGGTIETIFIVAGGFLIGANVGLVL